MPVTPTTKATTLRRRCRCCVEDIYQLRVKRHFWGADLAAHQQTTRQQTETTAPARLQSATAESAVAGCRRGTTQTTWLESDCLLTLTCSLITYLLTYLTPWTPASVREITRCCCMRLMRKSEESYHDERGTRQRVWPAQLKKMMHRQ